MSARLLALLCCLLLAACAGAPHAATPAAKEIEPAGEVSYACATDADCAVKNVGNCCGEYPACVNKDSPTFPDQVRAECAREGRMAVCGFPVISGCRCENARCTNVTDALPAEPADVK